MQYRRIWEISFGNLLQRKKSSFIAILGIVIGITTLIGIWGVVEGIKENVVSNLAQVIAPDELIVTPKYKKVYFLFEKEAKGEQPMDDTFVSELKKHENVVEVYPETSVVEQSTAYVEFQGNVFELDAPLFGMSREYFKDFPEFYKYNPGDDTEIPVLLSQRLVDIYNLSYGSSNGFQRINADAFIGKKFKLKVGYSSFYNAEADAGIKELDVKLIGFDDSVPTAGIVIPEEIAEELNSFFIGEKTEHYDRLIVKVSDPKFVPDIAEYVQEKGFRVQSLQDALSRFNSLITIILLTFTVIIFIILLVSAFNIYNTLHAAVLERGVEIGLWKTVGATKKTIARIYILEAVIMGFVGAIIGMLMGTLLGFVLAWFLEMNMPEVSLLSSGFISFKWHMYVVSTLVAIFISGIAGYGPAKRASKLYPIEVLKG